MRKKFTVRNEKLNNNFDELKKVKTNPDEFYREKISFDISVHMTENENEEVCGMGEESTLRVGRRDKTDDYEKLPFCCFVRREETG